MKRFILFGVASSVFLGGLFAWLLINKSSYVLLNYENQAFETSLWFFIVLLVLMFLFVNFCFSLLAKFYRPAEKWNTWKYARRESAAKRDFYQAILDYEVGAWDKALKRFKASANYIERPIVAYLYAARTANKLGRKDIREEFLHEAAQSDPESSLAVGLVRAEMHMDASEAFEAKKVLEELKVAAPSNHQIIKLLESLD